MGRLAKAFLGLVFLGLISNLADACTLNGPRYGLSSDNVSWSLELTSGESCIRGVRFNNVVVDKLTLVSAPQTGHASVVGPGFSYRAESDFQGRDHFVLAVTGTKNKVSGSSTIEVTVYVSLVGEQTRPSSMTAPSNDTDRVAQASSGSHGGTVVVDPPLGRVYPNATNTGEPAGVALKPSGALILSTPGQVVSGLDISGGVDIHASNVTLENCIIRVTDPTSNWVVSVLGGLTGVVIKNCEIIGPGLSATTQNAGIYVIGDIRDSLVTIDSCNIHEVGHGVDVSGGPVVIENSYIHDLNAASSSHYDGIYYGGGARANFSLHIQNNTIINSNGQTSAIFTENYFGAVNNVTVNNNLLVGGGYTVYLVSNTQSNGGGGSGGPVTNVSYTNNDLGMGQFGYTDFAGPYNPVYTGNVNDGAALAAALPVSPVISMASAAAGNYSTGNTLTLTLYTSEAVTVSGTPTLTLNDGGTATYKGAAGSNALTFSYTVASGQNTSALAVTAVNGTIKDFDGHALNASNLSATFTGVAIGTPNVRP